MAIKPTETEICKSVMAMYPPHSDIYPEVPVKSEHKTAGRYDANDKQVGIWFHRFYNCSDKHACQRRFEEKEGIKYDDGTFYDTMFSQ